MIAGYTHVPETGWGVMVPQPISELQARAETVGRTAVAVALAQLGLAILLSWWLASWISRPVRALAQSARRVESGDYTARIDGLPRHTPAELRRTARAFDKMVERIDQKARGLQSALARAEEVSRERAALLETAQQANRAKSQFVSMVSHELRTPLTSIRGAMELIEAGAAGPMPNRARDLVAMAIRNAQRLGRLIDDLLDVEKLGSGHMRFAFAPVELGEMLDEARRANDCGAGRNRVALRLIPPVRSVTVPADRDRLLQVMANLISNAVKFSPPGSTVDLALGTREDQAMIEVRDRGIGIPPEAGERIFDDFVQLDCSDQRAVGGSGLGLGIARSILRRHGGDLTYDIALGKGAVFRAWLPLAGETHHTEDMRKTDTDKETPE